MTLLPSSMIIEVGEGKYLKISNSIYEYKKQIESRLISFIKIKGGANNVKNLLEITPKYTKIKILGKEYLIKKKLVQTDIYTLINAMVSIILSDENNAFVHSSVVSKGKKGILLLGTFGQGKTALALEMEKEGFEINSADHTHLYLEGNKLFMKRGSKYLKYEKRIRFLEEDKVNSKIEIKEIMLLYGLCDEGAYKKSKIVNRNYQIKKIFPFLTWWSNCPLITDPKIILENSKYQEMFKFLMKLTRINKKIFIVRGDKRKISLEIKKKIEKDT